MVLTREPHDRSPFTLGFFKFLLGFSLIIAIGFAILVAFGESVSNGAPQQLTNSKSDTPAAVGAANL